jgi:hypothetical protein
VKNERLCILEADPFVPFSIASLVMPQTVSLARSRAIDMLADRVRNRFEGSLRTLYVFPDNPYEPTGDDEWIVLVAVLDDEYHDQHDASALASQAGCAFEEDVDWSYIATVFTASKTAFDDNRSGVVRAARREGVRL